MTGISHKDHPGKWVRAVNAIDGLVLLAGFLFLGAVWLSEGATWRLICSLVSVSAVAVFVVSTMTKQSQLRRGFRIGHSILPSPEEGSDMKKLVFDDFLYHPRKTSVSEAKERLDEIQSEATRKTVFPAHAQSPTSSVRVKQMMKPEAKNPVQEFQLSDFFDLDSEVFKGERGEPSHSEFRDEFDFLLNKILVVVRDVTFGHTVAFFWANREKQQMVCEARMTDSMSFLPSGRFTMGEDVVSQIARSGKPEMITHVNPSSEKELLRYYDQVEFVKSFVGVPVFYPTLGSEQPDSEPVGVIVADSTVEDAYGQETIALLGQFTKLISALIKTSTDKYDLLIDVELMNAIRRLQERIRSEFTASTIAHALADESSKLLNWNFLSVVLYDEVKRGWATNKVVNRVQEGYVSPEQLIDFEESIVGSTIKQNAHHLIQDLENQNIPRYYRGEKPTNAGSFLSVPISSLNKCYGALNIESRDKFNFSRKDVDILYRLAENAASAFEILYLSETIKEYVIIDDVTNAFTKKFFLKKLQEELVRADDYGTELSFLLMSIDHPNKIADRFGREAFETLLSDIVNIIRAGIRTYDAVGRYDYNRFGVILVNTTANEAYIWAEKMRKTIASHIMAVDGKSFSVTVTVGISGVIEDMKLEQLVEHTTAVLHKGMEAGGNSVRVF